MVRVFLEKRPFLYGRFSYVSFVMSDASVVTRAHLPAREPLSVGNERIFSLLKDKALHLIPPRLARCAVLLACWQGHEAITCLQNGIDLYAKAAHFQARAREHVSYRTHGVVPEFLILRFLEAMAAAFDGGFRNHAVVEAREQHFIRAIVGMRVEQRQQQAQLTHGELLLGHQARIRPRRILGNKRDRP